LGSTTNDFFFSFLVWALPIYGGRSHPMAIGGGPATLNGQRFFFFFFFFLVWAIGGSRTTPNGHGVASTAPDRLIRSGVAEAIPRLAGAVRPLLMGWSAIIGFLKIFFNLLLF
jgi:hypothetical protein